MSDASMLKPVPMRGPITVELHEIITNIAGNYDWRAIFDAHRQRTGKPAPIFSDITQSYSYDKVNIECVHVISSGCQDREHIYYTATCTWQNRHYDSNTYSDSSCVYDDLYQQLMRDVIREEMEKGT